MTTDPAMAELLSAYKTLLDKLDLALLPSGVIALFAIQQYRVNRLNLRLGLYSKRYAVFKKFLVFIKIICESNWQEWVDHEHGQGTGKIRDAYAKVMTAREEAEFLFDPNDEITQTIDKSRSESLHVGLWMRNLNNLSMPEGQKQMLSDRHKKALVNIDYAKSTLRGKPERYLSFRYVLP